MVLFPQERPSESALHSSECLRQVAESPVEILWLRVFGTKMKVW
jgi:hypothetical protein